MSAAVKFSINDFIGQLRFKLEDRERAFVRQVNALAGDQSAAGMLYSGATIKRHLDLMDTDYRSVAEEALMYAEKVHHRTDVDTADFISTTSSMLQNLADSYKAIANPEKFIPKGFEQRIQPLVAEAAARLDQFLIHRMRDFRFEIASGSKEQKVVLQVVRYVIVEPPQKEELTEALQELQQAVEGTNDASDEDRQIALSEIAAFEATIGQPRIATELEPIPIRLKHSRRVRGSFCIPAG